MLIPCDLGHFYGKKEIEKKNKINNHLITEIDLRIGIKNSLY
jgi:hypothetical protein